MFTTEIIGKMLTLSYLSTFEKDQLYGNTHTRTCHCPCDAIVELDLN